MGIRDRGKEQGRKARQPETWPAAQCRVLGRVSNEDHREKGETDTCTPHPTLWPISCTEQVLGATIKPSCVVPCIPQAALRTSCNLQRHRGGVLTNSAVRPACHHGAARPAPALQLVALRHGLP